MRAVSAAIVALVAAVVLPSAARPAAFAAQAGSGQPAVSVDRQDVAIGEPLVVTMTGFTGSSVTVALCGNLGKRGSSDCNMAASANEGIVPNGPTLEQLIVTAPPVPCPCIVRARGTANAEFAVAAVTIRDHPVGPVVDPHRGRLIDVDVTATREHSGLGAFVKSALGGPTRYRVRVAVRNLTTEPLGNVRVSGSARHRLRTSAASVDISSLGTLLPGQTREREIVSELPAPVVGRFTWQVAATGAGPTVAATTGSTNPAWLFVVLLTVLVADVVLMLARRVRVWRRMAVGAEALVG